MYRRFNSSLRRHLASSALLILVLGFVGLLAVGCQQLDPVQKVEALRATYTVKLTSWVIRAPADSLTADDAAGGEEEPDAAAAADDPELAGGDEVAAEPPAGPQEVILDVVVSHSTDERLPGITVEMTQADADQQVKVQRRLWLEPGETLRGLPTQVTLVLDDLEVAPGDMISLDLRPSVPPDERGEYREFAGAG